MHDVTSRYRIEHHPGGFTVVKALNGRELGRLWNPARRPVEITETRTENGGTSVRIKIR